jgi:hypothetical protein
MAARTLCAAIRQRLYAFGRDLATAFSDSRRRGRGKTFGDQPASASCVFQ